MRVRLRAGVTGAEWCEYTGRRLQAGATALTPGAPAFEPVARGPGVREARTEASDGDATFLQRGSLLTVELDRPFAHSQLASLACGAGETPIAGRRVAVSAGQRVVSADLEADVGGARWCLIEAPGAADLAVVVFR